MNLDHPVTGSLILLDANVLYPINICDFILTASSLQLLARPIISSEILDEALRNITTDRPDLEPARVERRFDAVRTATDGHDRTGPYRFADNSMINTKDRHVLATALHHDVDYVIVTNDGGLTVKISAWLAHRSRRHQLRAAISPDQLTAAHRRVTHLRHRLRVSVMRRASTAMRVDRPLGRCCRRREQECCIAWIRS